MKKIFNITLKKTASVFLIGIISVSMLASCGGTKQASTSSPSPIPSPTEAVVQTEEPMAKADEKSPDLTPTITPQSAEEAANDVSAITNEIESLTELIADGNYDDAMMQIKALMTKNLTDEQKQTLEDLKTQIEDKMGQ